MSLSKEAVGYIAVLISIIFFGTFAVPSKTRAMRRVQLDPVVFGIYMALAIFASSWLVLAWSKPFRWTYWGAVSACLWVPANVLAITAIRYVGLSIAQGLWCGITIIVSFVWGVAYFGQRPKDLPLALVGLVTLVFGVLALSLCTSDMVRKWLDRCVPACATPSCLRSRPAAAATDDDDDGDDAGGGKHNAAAAADIEDDGVDYDDDDDEYVDDAAAAVASGKRVVNYGATPAVHDERRASTTKRSAQKALVAGKRGLIIDIEVRQLDDAHPEFEPDLLIHFVTEVSKALAAVSGRAKVMLRGHELAARATEMLQTENMEAVELGIDPREDVTFCSLKTSDPDQEGDPDSMRKFASKVTSELGEDERLVVMACPKSNADVIVMREVIEAAKGRPVVLLNPRMVHMPRETNDYDTVYLLRQFNVHPIKSDPRKEARKSPFKISPQQRKQQHIFSELGQVIPKVLTTRAFPDDFKLYLDVDGEGFQLEYTYDRKPHPTTVCLRAQSAIKEVQREITRQQRVEGDKKRQQEMKDRWEDEEDDDDDDIIMPRKLTNEEIDAMLRD